MKGIGNWDVKVVKWKGLMELVEGVELELGSGRGWEVKGVGNGDREVGKWND